MAGNIKREGPALKRALVGDGGRSRSAVADDKIEAFADRQTMRVGRRHRDRIFAKVAVGRDARDDTGMRIDTGSSRQ